MLDNPLLAIVKCIVFDYHPLSAATKVVIEMSPVSHKVWIKEHYFYHAPTLLTWYFLSNESKSSWYKKRQTVAIYTSFLYLNI